MISHYTLSLVSGLIHPGAYVPSKEKGAPPGMCPWRFNQSPVTVGRLGDRSLNCLLLQRIYGTHPGWKPGGFFGGELFTGRRKPCPPHWGTFA